MSGDELGFRFETVDARSADARAAMEQYFGELDQRFPTGFDPGDALASDAETFDPPSGAFVVVRDGARPGAVGCGGLLRLAEGVGEIKRMWIAPAARGRGLASALLAHLEGLAAERGYQTVRLDTNATLVEAIAMYERRGYSSIERYNANPYAERWFEKRL